MTSEEFVGDLVAVLYAEPDELIDSADLRDLGLTSISLARLLDRWTERDVRATDLNFATLAADTSVGRWRELLVT